MFSKLVPTTQQRSFYEQLRHRDEPDDVEDQAGRDIDEANLNLDFHDDELDPETLAVENSQQIMDVAATISNSRRDTVPATRPEQSNWLTREDGGDNDVPASLLVEHTRRDATASRPSTNTARLGTDGGGVTRTTASRQLGRAQRGDGQRPEPSRLGGYTVAEATTPAARSAPKQVLTSGARGNAYQKTMWRWVNVTNLDNFVKDVYDYYQGHGLWCILQERILHLIDVAFVAIFLTFLTQCVAYIKIPQSKALDQVIIPQCTKKMSGLWNLGLWIFVFYFVWKLFQFIVDLRRLFSIRDFYALLLGIPEQDMQSVSWQDVVACIMALRDQNPRTADNLSRENRAWVGSQSKERLDAHDMANRLMRRENYLIALFNKDILDLRVPVPFLRHRQLLSRTLEWTLIFSVLDFVFDDRGQVNQEFLRADRRGTLSKKLKARFLFAGTMNLVMAPFLTGYLVIVYILTYYNEYQKNPSALGARSYTPLAEWKFREFNELPHLFRERLNMSYPFATRYLDQFPKHMTERLAKTIAFVAGSLVAVLAMASLIDPEMFLSFEVTQDRTVLFYLGVFGSLWAFARGMVRDENNVFDPEYALRNVIEYTHHHPDHWQGRLHSFETKLEFADLYKNRIVIFLEEILSILITPLILFLSLPNSSDQIIDFFREFTVHVDGLGYVCSFAVFDFQKGVEANTRQPDPALAPSGSATDVRNDYYSTKHGKMAASYYGFIDNYVVNPKTGIPGHLPPGARHQFQPPPQFPGLNSPTLAANMHSPRATHSGRTRSRGPGTGPVNGRTTRLGLDSAHQSMSPMASMLLDPHHQPQASAIDNARSRRRTRLQQPRGRGMGLQGERSIIEESFQGPGQVTQGSSDDHGLEESTWQTSPSKTTSRETTAAMPDEDQEIGVLGLMYQFQKEMQQRPGGVR